MSHLPSSVRSLFLEGSKRHRRVRRNACTADDTQPMMHDENKKTCSILAQLIVHHTLERVFVGPEKAKLRACENAIPPFVHNSLAHTSNAQTGNGPPAAVSCSRPFPCFAIFGTIMSGRSDVPENKVSTSHNCSPGGTAGPSATHPTNAPPSNQTVPQPKSMEICTPHTNKPPGVGERSVLYTHAVV